MDDKYLSVTAITRYLKHKIDTDEHLQNVYIRGEISNFKAHSRGHLYFSIKDEYSKINAIMFANVASKLKFQVEDGMKVLIKGRISVYEPTGNYQIYVSEMLEDGIGNLYIAFEQLKTKLHQEGLFAKEHKKDIPKMPNKIGIITAKTGAAIKDILSTMNRRYPICETILFPSSVQGQGAYLDLIKQLKKAQEYDLDIIIIGRGGGSIEDLWPFNEELLARAIYDCPIPIISAVGHEIDWTISDYVADVRAATPTGAAELAVPSLKDLLNNIEYLKIRGNKAISHVLKNYQVILTKLKSSHVLKNPITMYQIKEQMLDNYLDRMQHIIKNILFIKKDKLKYLRKNYILYNPQKIYEYQQHKLDKFIEKLEILNPLSTLKRGYAIIKKEGRAITNIKKLKKEDNINIILNKGIINANINYIKEEQHG